MLKTRLLAPVAAFAVGFAPMIALAAPVDAPVYKSGGVPVHGAGVFCIDLAGNYVGCGSGSTSSLAPWTPDNASLTTAAPTGTSSLSTAFSGSGTTVYVKNIGNVGVHLRGVLTSGTALLTDEHLLPGMCGPIARGTADRLALITDGGTGSVEITTGTGNPGFGICADMSAAGSGLGATGAAVPPNALFLGGNSGGNLVGIIQASAHASVKITTATTTQIIPLSGTTRTFITYARIRANAAANVNLVYGTGTNCGTGTTDVYAAEPLTTFDGFSGGSGLGPIFVIPAGQATCLKSDAAVTTTAQLAYTQAP